MDKGSAVIGALTLACVYMLCQRGCSNTTNNYTNYNDGNYYPDNYVEPVVIIPAPLPPPHHGHDFRHHDFGGHRFHGDFGGDMHHRGPQGPGGFGGPMRGHWGHPR